MQEPDHVPLPAEPSSDEEDWQPVALSDSDGEGDDAAAAVAQQFEHMYLDGFVNPPPAHMPDLQWVLNDDAALDDNDDPSGPLQVRDFPYHALCCLHRFVQCSSLWSGCYLGCLPRLFFLEGL